MNKSQRPKVKKRCGKHVLHDYEWVHESYPQFSCKRCGNPTDVPCQCEWCDKSFGNTQELIEHQRETHDTKHLTWELKNHQNAVAYFRKRLREELAACGGTKEAERRRRVMYPSCLE